MSQNIKIGDQVCCTYAATSWYNHNQIYDVVSHPQTGLSSVIGSDGYYDMLSMCVSKFEKVTKQQRNINQVLK